MTLKICKCGKEFLDSTKKQNHLVCPNCFKFDKFQWGYRDVRNESNAGRGRALGFGKFKRSNDEPGDDYRNH